jgi:hypothetical protein
VSIDAVLYITFAQGQGTIMNRLIVSMWISVDGYVAGPEDSMD